MAKTSRPGNNEDKVEFPTLALLANGSSGRWSVTLDESTEDTEEWFLQIEGPSLTLFCELEDGPDRLHDLANFLETPSAKPEAFVIGRVDWVPLRLLWDVEDEKGLCFAVGPASRPLVRYSIHGADIRDFVKATQQAALDLEDATPNNPARSEAKQS